MHPNSFSFSSPPPLSSPQLNSTQINSTRLISFELLSTQLLSATGEAKTLVAIKQLTAVGGGDATVAAEIEVDFDNEVKIMQMLTSGTSNVVQLLGVCTEVRRH